MEQKTDYRTELKRAIERAENMNLLDNSAEWGPDGMEAAVEVVCGLTLVAEENYNSQRRCWENSRLANSFLAYAKVMERKTDDLSLLKTAAERICETIGDHPRLMVNLLYFRLLLSKRCAAQGEMEDDVEELSARIRWFLANIGRADRGELDSIEDEGILKRDPVEWTEKYESVIDKVEMKVEEKLEGVPRGMGFCFEYWHEKCGLLAEYGIAWNSPAVMNPRVMFD